MEERKTRLDAGKKFIAKDVTRVVCSNCKKRFFWPKRLLPNFCPNCGASHVTMLDRK